MLSRNISYLLCSIVIILIFLGYVTSSLALLLGILCGISRLFDPTIIRSIVPVQSTLLKASVIGLGFGINITAAFKIGTDNFFISFITILVTFLLAFVLGRIFKSEKKLTLLIASGTAICGGSAIAAISPSIKANSEQTSMSLAIVFILNAIALFIFPSIGHYFELTQTQFGLWCAIAIHDTSSVIGSSEAFGIEALSIATTTKLVRALWVVPLVFLVSAKTKSINRRAFPWFIFGFIIAICLTSYVPGIAILSSKIVWFSRKLLIATLFLIGLQINFSQIKRLGFKTFALGTLTWLILIVLSLYYIIQCC